MQAGESTCPNSFKIDGNLSEEGQLYAQRLKKFVLAYREKKNLISKNADDKERPLTVWTSTRKKAKQTALPFVDAGFLVRQHSVLNQMNPGEADGLSVEELKKRFPDEIERAKEDPYRHRYPRAEV